MNPQYSDYLLHAKIDSMSEYIDLGKFIQGEKNSLKLIRSYYRINDYAYRRFHSKDGFMHFRISSKGVFSDEDIYYQPDTVSRYIKPGSVVMELGFGQAANLLYLAHCHPDATFIGVDLLPLKARDVPSNVSSYVLDYSNLSRFEDNSIDVMYAFETIVHNSDKEKIYREVCRVLKPGGVMIVYDYALKAPFDTYDEHIQKAIALISKGGASAMIESLDELNSHYTNSGLEIARLTDHTQATLPDLKRLDRMATKVLKRRLLTRIMFRFLPDQFVANIILGYLGYDSGNAGVLSYQEWVLRKPLTSDNNN
ncbi:MAG: class I SAM-dependent methyltransferase [Prevotella sp.]|nr:class I SAM-dependent methyltransferase [Prevotella sp.]